MSAVSGQLLYTWAGRRPGHDSGFQVVAASGQLARQDSEVAQAAVRLCRYVPPRGVRTGDIAAMPVAYGWADLGGTRLAFRRAYAGRDLLGRPGNFYAHIVAGTPDMGTSMLAAGYDSAFWWRGEHLDEYLSGTRTLQASPSGAIPPGPLPSVDQTRLAALCESLLIPGAHLPYLLDVAPADAVALLHAACLALPGVLDRMPCSTYEPPATASMFAIVGTTGTVAPASATVVPPGPHPSTARTVRRTRELALSHLPAERDIVLLALFATTSPDGEVDLARLADLVTIFDRHHSLTSSQAEALLPILASPVPARLILRQPRALEAVANLLVTGHRAGWGRFRAIVSQLPAALLQELGTAVGGGASISAPLAVDSVLRQARSCPASFADACAEAVLIEAKESPAVLSGVGSDAVRLLVSTATRLHENRHHQKASGVVATLLRLPEAYPGIATDRSVPPAWRAEVLAAELVRSRGHAARVAAVLAAEPHLVSPFARTAGRHQVIIDVLNCFPSSARLPHALAAGTALGDAERYELWTWLLPQLPLDAQMRTLIQHRRLIDPAKEPRWTALVSELTHKWTVGDHLTGAARVGTRDVLILIRHCQPVQDCWLTFLQEYLVGRLGKWLAADRAEWTPLLAELARIGDPAVRTTAVDLTLVAAVAAPAAGLWLSALVRNLAPLDPDGCESVATRLLRAGLRLARYPNSRVFARLCLGCVADLVESKELRTWINGSLRFRDAQRLARALAEHLTDHDRSAGVAELKNRNARRNALQWWRVTTARHA